MEYKKKKSCFDGLHAHLPLYPCPKCKEGSFCCQTSFNAHPCVQKASVNEPGLSYCEQCHRLILKDKTYWPRHGKETERAVLCSARCQHVYIGGAMS
jgi:hypothetical protein